MSKTEKIGKTRVSMKLHPNLRSFSRRYAAVNSRVADAANRSKQQLADQYRLRAGWAPRKVPIG
jgi:hypothetical protein